MDPLSGAKLELKSGRDFELVLPDGDVSPGDYRYSARQDVVELHMQSGGVGQADMIDGCVIIEGQSIYFGTNRQFHVTFWDQLPPLILIPTTRDSPGLQDAAGEYTHGSSINDLPEMFSETLVLKTDG